MLPLLALAVCASAGALVVGVAVARWPTLELAAPHVTVRLLRREIRVHPRLAALLRRRIDPLGTTGALLGAGLAVVVTAAFALGILLAMVRNELGLARSDPPLAGWAAEHAGPVSTQALRVVTLLGGTSTVVVLALATAAFELRRTLRWSVVGLLLLTVTGQFAVVNAIKWLVDRPRPDVLQLSGFSGASFPSGHAAAAAATFACVALVVGRGRPRPAQVALAATAGGISTAVSASRVLLGVHWLTDVVAGSLVGWSWFALCSIAFGGRRLRFGTPVEVAEELAGDPSADRRNGGRSARGSGGEGGGSAAGEAEDAQDGPETR